ncbi:MAG: hypothetical protein KDJ74_15065 [Notoacmeibacter sp.]|nr:hypothetical protein [Notoacmeibacter sp.]
MEKGMPDNRVAARAAIDRLLQMRRLWENAARAYFEPSRFLLEVQNCLMTSRTVTFIIQSNKDALPGFDQWYAAHQERMKADPIMVWAKDARNKVEKQGDLSTHSQVSAEIIASYLDGPKTDWLPSNVFATTDEIFRAVPQKFRVPHVVEHGTLLVERRWIDAELPEMELLEALAHAYSVLSDIVADFVKTLGLPIPSMIEDSRPTSMERLAMDRAIYVSMKEGSIIGVRREEARDPPIKEKQFIKRYGRKGAKSWEKAKEAETFQQACEAFFRSARILLKTDGYHGSLALFLKGSHLFRVIGADQPDRASRYILMRELASFAVAEGADGVILINEAWIAAAKDIPKHGYAVDAKNRQEALALAACNATGEEIHITATFHRKKNKLHKVKSIEPNKMTVGTPSFMLVPFMKVWGRYDPKNYEEIQRKMDEAGLSLPMEAPESTA